MVNNVSRISRDEPFDNRRLQRGWELKHYSSELIKLFLISKNTPKSLKEHKEIEKISKNLSLLLWIAKAEILSCNQEYKISEQIKYITENFRQSDLYSKTWDIIQNIKNLSAKTSILELFTEIEYEACLCKDKKQPSINQENLQKEFEKILELMNRKNDKFSIMKLERELKEIQTIFHKDPSRIDLLLYNLDQITHQ